MKTAKSINVLLFTFNIFLLFFIVFGFTYLQLTKEPLNIPSETVEVYDYETVAKDTNLKTKRYETKILGILDSNEITQVSVPTPPDYTNYPLLPPTKGYLSLSSSTYTDKHGGIDIFTSLNGTSTTGVRSGKGNPVYASCDGKIGSIKENNGEIVLNCNEKELLKYSASIPSTKIALIYAHLADVDTNQSYILVKQNQLVKRGDLIGYQGNKSSYVPSNRWIHLHFGVFNLNGNKFIDPSPYFNLKDIPVKYLFK